MFLVLNNPFIPGQLSVCKFFLHYPYKTGCLVMRIKQMIVHSNVSKMKNKILPACLQGKCRDSLGEFSNTSYGVLGLTKLKVRQFLFSCIFTRKILLLILFFSVLPKITRNQLEFQIAF